MFNFQNMPWKICFLNLNMNAHPLSNSSFVFLEYCIRSNDDSKDILVHRVFTITLHFNLSLKALSIYFIPFFFLNLINDHLDFFTYDLDLACTYNCLEVLHAIVVYYLLYNYYNKVDSNRT